MTNAEVSRAEVEDFLFQEADFLDRWELDNWLGLWTGTGEWVYEITPTSEPEASTLKQSEVMFLIADDRFRLEQRVIRMKKNTFHAEYLRSRTRHIYGHVRVLQQDAKTVEAVFNAAVYRTKRGVTVIYPSAVHITLSRSDNGLRLKRKRVELDLDYLSTMGALTIIL